MFSPTAALITGALTLAITPAFAQDKAAADAKPAAATPAAPAKKDAPAATPTPAKDAAAAPAKDAKKDAAAAPVKDAKKDAKPLTPAQKKTEAGKLFKEGKEKFEKGDYTGALASYRSADEVLPGVMPKYQIAVTLDKLNQVTDAVAGYQAFIDYVDAQAKADKKFDAAKWEPSVTEAKTRIEALKKTPATVKIATTPETAPNLMVTVDDKPPAPAGELKLEPGKHTLAYSAEGYNPSTPQEIEVGYAETREVPAPALEKKPEPVAVAPPPPPEPVAPAPVAPPPPPPPPRSNVPAYVTLGLAGVGAVVGTIFGISALGSKSDFEKQPTTENADKTDRNALIADMSFAVALTFGVTGAVLLFGGDDKPAEQKTGLVVTKPVVVPFVSPTGGGAAALVRF
jgi:hypothetical protein